MQDDPEPRRAPLVAVVLVLVATGAVLTDQHLVLTLPAAGLAVLALLVVARWDGLTAAGVGLARADAGRGATWAGCAVVLVGLAAVLMAWLPVGQGLFDDGSMPHSTLEAALRVLLVIPVRTVLVEELAFRGVLWGMVDRRWGSGTATVVSSVAFGLWHVPAAFRLVRSNEAAESFAAAFGWGTVVVVVAVVASTACAGVLLCELRRRSGSLLAPMGLHWAVNAVGTVMSVLR